MASRTEHPNYNWDECSSKDVKSRTPIQCKSHYHNQFDKSGALRPFKDKTLIEPHLGHNLAFLERELSLAKYESQEVFQLVEPDDLYELRKIHLEDLDTKLSEYFPDQSIPPNLGLEILQSNLSYLVENVKKRRDMIKLLKHEEDNPTNIMHPDITECNPVAGSEGQAKIGNNIGTLQNIVTDEVEEESKMVDKNSEVGSESEGSDKEKIEGMVQEPHTTDPSGVKSSFPEDTIGLK